MTTPRLTVADAMYFAHAAHRDQRDHDGQQHFDHVRRVARMVPAIYQRVAWLHDVIEDTDVTIDDLDGRLPADELEALRLLTRRVGGVYQTYINRIAEADSMAGAMARAVKEADLLDNLTRCLRSGDANLARRYRLALPLIQQAMVAR